MDIHKLFQSDSSSNISGETKDDLKEQLGFDGDKNENNRVLLIINVQGRDLTEFTVKGLESRKPDILHVSSLKEIEDLLTIPEKDRGFSIALINTRLGPSYPVCLSHSHGYRMLTGP